MAKRQQSYQFVDSDAGYVVHVSRGHRTRRYELSRGVLFGAGAAASLLFAVLAAAGGYALFRDDMLAGLLDRQAQMQYAYEDKIAALRLRLDQMASRQFVDQDGVEGKVQSLVMRQAKLETRAAVVAQLVERTVSRGDLGLAPAVAPARAPAETRPASASVAIPSPPQGAALASPPKAQQGAAEDVATPAVAKPEPEGMDLRLLRDSDNPAALPAPTRKDGGELVPIDTSFAPRGASLASAADPDLPMPTRLESLAISLDRIENEQARRLSGLVRPAVEAATRLRRAFDVAGLSVERYVARDRARHRAASAVGGPFLAADPRGDAQFERELATAETALDTLDGLRRALPMAPLRKPLSGELQLTSVFGYRTDPFLGRPALHSGVDLREAWGAPVRATAGGVVAAAGPSGGYGNMVEIDHGGGLSTRYGHLSAIAVTPGQQVHPGASIGRVGSTGRSTGPHLHYEVRINGEAVDPQRFLRAASALGGIAQ
jgi:murein DD-endopeptidase MepM/ murein hydrolase activator NlpD